MTKRKTNLKTAAAAAAVRNIAVSDLALRLKGDQIDSIHADLSGVAEKAFARANKREKVATLEATFTDDAARTKLSAEVRARVDSWTPADLQIRAETPKLTLATRSPPPPSSPNGRRPTGTEAMAPPSYKIILYAMASYAMI